jgi:hypothetical protein
MKYVISGSSDDYGAAVKVQEYARSVGIALEISETGLVQSVALDSPQRQVAIPLSERPHQLYAILRGEELGYLGVSVDAGKRLQQHANKIAIALDPFVKWLADGKTTGDLSYIVKDFSNKKEAVAEEKKLIQKYNPKFNKQHINGEMFTPRTGGLPELA